jgi:hypothetical protein
MHFGATVREILTASCGHDFRNARATTVVALESEAAERTLAANLELTFGITIRDRDLRELRTVRDVLQCVRLRLWEQRMTSSETAATPPAVRVAARSTSSPYERFQRYTPAAAPFVNLPAGAARPKRA